MNAVRFVRGAGGFTVSFRYGSRLVDLVKAVPAGRRRWNKTTKTWWVANPHGAWLADDLTRAGYIVAGEHERDDHRDGAVEWGAWAQTLFAAVGPDRAAAVHRALARVLHPDVGGDTALMQEAQRCPTRRDMSRAHRRPLGNRPAGTEKKTRGVK